MRKNIWVASFVFFGLVVSPVWALEGSFAFQGGAVQAFGGPSSQPSFGANGFAYIDFKIVPSLSFGVATSFSSLMKGPDRLYVDGTELIGRLEPFGHSSWTPYFMLGAGFRPFYDAQPNHRWLAGGDFQGLAGLGLRHNLVKGMDLDVSVFYNLNPVTSESLSSAGVRAGFAFPFGGEDAKVSVSPEAGSALPKKSVVAAEAQPSVIQVEAAPAPSKAPETAPEPEAPVKEIHSHSKSYHWSQPRRKKYGAIRFRWKKNSTLESVAAAAYGEPCDFPIIVDANKEKLGSPAALKKGTIILLPQDVTSQDLERACGKAEKAEYKAWNSVR